jgi:hypothetical protein
VNSEKDYLKSLVHQLWEYAESELVQGADILETEHRDALRPPVFRKETEAFNILTPPDADKKLLTAIEATLPLKERHRWFRSMKSSQAVAQSVFGNLIATGNLGLLEGLETDQGLPAFCEELSTAKVQLEYSVKHLGEPRPTSVDLWIDGSRRIAVECKLTEADFGTCSRPRLKEGKDKNYARDYCDGSYTRQRDRQSRCSLTEMGVEYWDHVPFLFNWKSTDDFSPCPLSNTYQLVRNVLASCVTSRGLIDSENAHTLIVYDARYPSFQLGGKANNQWKSARAALKDPGLLRSVSWQSLVEYLARNGEVSWLVNQLEKKYGF